MLAETMRQLCSAAAYAVVQAYPGRRFAHPSPDDEGRISRSPAGGRSPGVMSHLVAVVFRVLISAAAVPYVGLIGYNVSRMWDKYPFAEGGISIVDVGNPSRVGT